jgi:hypothetical protein
MKTFTVDELSRYSTLKSRWIKEKVRKLKLDFPQLIKGGGRPGANNKYRVDIRLIDKIVGRTYKSNDKKYIDLLSKTRYESYWEWFNSMDWEYFCCVNPATEWSPERLKNFISDNGLTIFYSVHTMLKYGNVNLYDRPNHIHFVIKRKDKKRKIWDYKLKIRGNLDFSIVRFDKERKRDCFDYMLKMGKYRDDTQRAIDWDVL